MDHRTYDISSYSREEQRTLVLLLHAFTNTPSDMRFVEHRIKEILPDAHIVTPLLPLSDKSFADPCELAADMVALVDAQVAHRSASSWLCFEEIVFVGHSLGALIARKAYLYAGPESASARFEFCEVDAPCLPPRPWFTSVRRMILLAGMNRGWQLTHHLGPVEWLKMRCGAYLLEALLTVGGSKRRHIILTCQFGSPFVTNLRLQWLALQRDLPGIALVVQLLGTEDGLVAPSDNVDLATGRNFAYLDVPHSSHSNVLVMDDTPKGLGRAETLRRALTDAAVALMPGRLLPTDGPLVPVDTTVSNVIFVMHGIRDTGFWTQKIARKVEAIGGKPPQIYASETSTYGYFAMLPFLFPGQRRKRVRWFMDQYVEARATYPNAKFSFVGHSNGTYLAAKALADYASCRFDRVVFAGSVVRTTFPWELFFERNQVGAVLNYVATNDLVVAVLPGAWEIMGWQDIGSAGHNGFQSHHPLVHNIRYIAGDHGCGVREENWAEIAHFIVSDPLSFAREGPTVAKQQSRAIWAGRHAPAVWVVMIFLVGVGGLLFCLVGSLFGHPGMGLICYLLLLRYFLTRW